MNEVEVRKGQGRALTASEFYKLTDIPPEIEWFANLRNPNTRKAYDTDLREFRQFFGIERPEEFRTITRAHVIAWRKDLERRLCAPTTISGNWRRCPPCLLIFVSRTRSCITQSTE